MEHNGVSMLRIEPVRAGRDDAPYECVAENGVGDAVSAEAALTVYESDKTPAGFPTIEVKPSLLLFNYQLCAPSNACIHALDVCAELINLQQTN